MRIADAEIPNTMVATYVRAIKDVYASPTRASDGKRAEMHAMILAEAGTTRHDHAFMGALSDTVMEMLEPPARGR